MQHQYIYIRIFGRTYVVAPENALDEVLHRQPRQQRTLHRLLQLMIDGGEEVEDMMARVRHRTPFLSCQYRS